MSMSTPIVPLIVKGVTYTGTCYLLYELYKMQKYESKAKKIEAMREHRQKQGLPVDDIEESPEVKQYRDDHYGRKLMERMQTQYLIEDNIKHQIEEKKALREKIKDDIGEQQLADIDNDIQRLHDLFKQVSPERKIAHPAQEFINKKDKM